MQTQKFILNSSCKRETIEKIIQLTDNTTQLIYVLPKTNRTFLSETTYPVNCRIFMLAPQKNDVLWKFDFQSHQKANSLKGVKTFINIISQKDVLIALHLLFVWKTKTLKESQ